MIVNLLKDLDNYGERKSCGRPQCLTAQDNRAIIRIASNLSLTMRQIAKKVAVTINIS